MCWLLQKCSEFFYEKETSFFQKLVHLEVEKEEKHVDKKGLFCLLRIESQVKFLNFVRVEEVSSLPYDEVCPRQKQADEKQNRGEDKTIKEPELDCSSSWSLVHVTRWSGRPSRRNGRRHYSTYY